jgi:hypothetical protein
VANIEQQLPVQGHSDQKAMENDVATNSPKALRTLIVEDDPVHLVLVRSYVERLPMLQFVASVASVQMVVASGLCACI